MQNQVNMLKREFVLNKKFLNEEFMLPKNKEGREWYFSIFSSKSLELFKKLYYITLQNLDQHIYIYIYFFNWFENYYKEKKSKISLLKIKIKNSIKITKW